MEPSVPINGRRGTQAGEGVRLVKDEDFAVGTNVRYREGVPVREERYEEVHKCVAVRGKRS